MYSHSHNLWYVIDPFKHMWCNWFNLNGFKEEDLEWTRIVTSDFMAYPFISQDNKKIIIVEQYLNPELHYQGYVGSLSNLKEELVEYLI